MLLILLLYLRFAHLFFYFGLINEHDGDVVANRINAVTLDALQAALVRLHLHRGFTYGAHKYFE